MTSSNWFQYCCIYCLRCLPSNKRNLIMIRADLSFIIRICSHFELIPEMSILPSIGLKMYSALLICNLEGNLSSRHFDVDRLWQVQTNYMEDPFLSDLPFGVLGLRVAVVCCTALLHEWLFALYCAETQTSVKRIQ